MKIKIPLLTIILAIGVALPTCQVEDDLNCSCPPVLGEYFDIQGFELFNYKKRDGASIAMITENESISFSDFHGMLIQYEAEYHSYNCTQKGWNFSLINSALACSCIENGFGGSKTEKLKNLTVITLNDFNEQYAANDTLNNLIVVKEYNYEIGQDLNLYLEQDTSLIRSEHLWLGLKESPTLEKEVRLKLILELSTEEIFEVENAPIVFQ